jgi:formylglycine-generating enzyme required for sulfatase activity
MVVVPAGSFMMGSPDSELGREAHEGPLHKVTIASPFAVGKFEVTWGEWEACVRDGVCNNGWGLGKHFLYHPVSHISLKDAQIYLRWLSKKTGQTYRLLSEAEWEYVARAGTTMKYSFPEPFDDLCGSVNLGDQSSLKKGWMIEAVPCNDGYPRTAPVGTFKPNGFGIYDVHGNVSEWVEDCYHESYRGAPGDGSAWASDECKYRQGVIRGGSFFSFPEGLRSASRFRITQDDLLRPDDVGFRVVRVLD